MESECVRKSQVVDLSLLLSHNFWKAGHGSCKVGGAKKWELCGKQAIGPSAPWAHPIPPPWLILSYYYGLYWPVLAQWISLECTTCQLDVSEVATGPTGGPNFPEQLDLYWKCWISLNNWFQSPPVVWTDCWCEHPGFKNMIDIAACATESVTIPNCKQTRKTIIELFKVNLTKLQAWLNVHSCFAHRINLGQY